MSSRSKILVLCAFVLTLAAGAVVGVLTSRLSKAGVGTTPAQANRSPLAAALDLTPEQSAQMQKIWEKVRDSASDCVRQAQALQLERERSFEGLLSEQQKIQYDKIKTSYNARIEALDSQRNASFQAALQQTQRILTETQRAKYEKILRERTGRDFPAPGELDLNGIHPGATTPATRPVTGP